MDLARNVGSTLSECKANVKDVGQRQERWPCIQAALICKDSVWLSSGGGGEGVTKLLHFSATR